MRLEALRQGRGYFLVAGPREAFRRGFDRLAVNADGTRKRFFPQVLPLETPAAESGLIVKVRECPVYMQRFYRSFEKSYNIALPVSYRATLEQRVEGYHTRATMWRIASVQNRKEFSPEHEWASVGLSDVDEETSVDDE